MSQIEAGFAKADITPDVNRQTLYHRSGHLDDAHTPIIDRLYARATAFRCNNEVAIWVTCDLLCVDTRLRERVVAGLEREGIPPARVALCATHTHSAPTIVKFHGVEATPEEYLAFLEKRLIEVALNALRSAKPARIAFAKTTVDLSANRRQIGRMSAINDLHAPTGLVDNTVTVAKIDVEDGRKGLLFNYAAHPICMSRNTPLISSDYPGRAYEYLEKEGRLAHAQFLQGCAGNANMKIHGGEKEASTLGNSLAQAALHVAQGAKPSAVTELRMTTQTIRLPWGKMATREEAQAVLAKERAASRPDPRKLEWAQGVLRTYEKGPVLPYAEVLVQAMRLGDAVFLALPGEVFLEIGLAIKKQARIKHLFIAAYANNCEIGYIPTRAAFSEGGYEVDIAPYYYGLFQLSPECEQILVDTGVRAVQSIY